ncbi:MAG: AAA family ATPase [Actinomycetota bacterium]|nr:AAA family ATPase [Actinomycetota bacterium]
MTVVCPSCGQETPEGFPRCANCGARLAGEAQTTREERKVVTCLFCDLVGFTARAERMDPEDVRRLLQPYHARLRLELERHGGTVEKFIGDAVMAVFGAPIAHEDDPERAVRAALAIRDALAEEGELEIRIGITTGEALIALGARPEMGEGMASGDGVNTAARIQAAAPVGSVLVDETTFRATERAIEYEESEAIVGKGKTSATAVWKALCARARVGVERVGGAPLVGRERELTLLRETFARVTRESKPQLLTLVGVPGIGKSRLVFELFQTIESGEFGIVFWRRGGSLPYGDGVTFWALSEMVKAQAGILESDTPEDSDEKLGQAVQRFFPDTEEAAWVERHLRPLAGLETDETWTADRRSEAFAAWRRFFEALAEARPLVLVFEDLHWADEALLDFVDHLVDWASGVPLLALCTARPELLARRPGWGGGKVNSSTILLSALSTDETAALVHALLGRPAISTDVQAQLLERAGGNPLYAEEFTRMLAERSTELVLPETVQGIVAARLDTLSREEKELLQDAAVIGKVFWLGALGAEPRALEERLHSLERKEFVSRERRSSVAGESEYAFRHALVREVAYEQIPRSERASKHFASAEWIESLGRTEDHAEMLAHHYLTALELSRAAGRPLEDVADAARVALREAGDRAFSLNAFPPATRYYAGALELWPSEDPDRAELLFRLARARFVSVDELRDHALEEAREALLASGRSERAAEADALLAEVWWQRGDRARCDLHLDRAAALVDELPASPGKAHVLSQIARYHMVAGAYEEAIHIGEEALAMAEQLELDEVRAHALNNIGAAKSFLARPEGITDLERGLDIALAVRSPEAARILNNLGAALATSGDLARCQHYLGEAVRVGDELGAVALARYSRAVYIAFLLTSGAWDEGLPQADAFIADSGTGVSDYAELQVRRSRARARFARGDVNGALDDVGKALEAARPAKDPQVLIPTLGIAARVYAELGRDDEARLLAAELLEAMARSGDWRLFDFVWVAERLHYGATLRRLIEQAPAQTRWSVAFLAVLDREFETAASLFLEIGALNFEADARLRAAEKLVAEGRRSEAGEQLEKALAFFRSVGATRYVSRSEELLAAAS